MRMVPNAPFDTGSPAEKLMFDRLRRAFDDRYVAYHSLKPTRHPHKRFPEIDFVICGPEGLYVLEVKGGRISFQDGLWHYRNRFDRTGQSQEGPFRQAESALRGLMERAHAGLPAHVLHRLPAGYGVVFPDCDWPTVGAEWEPEMLADRRRSRDMEGWLRGLFTYWRRRCKIAQRLDHDALGALHEFLRPNAHAGTTDADRFGLHEQVEDVRRRVERLTEDQMRMADVAAENPRVLCSGGAGTGKTFLAERLARNWTESGMHVALVCRSPWLRHYLTSRLAMPGLTVSLIDGVRLDCRRAGRDRFDALIVDEGQDLFEMACIEALDDVLDGGMRAGRWCWFHDLNNQVVDSPLRAAGSGLSGRESIPCACRCGSTAGNTRIILEWIQDTLGADMGVRGAGTGPEVRLYTAADRNQSAGRVAREIIELVDAGGLAPGSVTILSPLDYAESSVAQVPGDMADRIRRLDEYSMRAMPLDKVGFARIDEFKGLENEAIIVVDLPACGKLDPCASMHYVAMSRARSVLSIVQARFA